MDRRTHILEAARHLLLQYGPGKVTVADIAREAGVGVGSVYLDYRSKDEILIALSAQRYELVLSAMRRAARHEANPAERVREVLRARLQAFLTLAEDGAHGSELLHCYCPAVEEAWRRFTVAEAELLAEVLAEGVAAGALVGEAQAAAETVLAACATLSPPLLCKRRPADVAARAERLFALLLDGLRRH